jgi:arylsulfatase A-like enzyme
MTSLYPSELGIHFQRTLSVDMHLDHRRVTLAEALGDAGYRTQAYVANPLLIPDHGFAQGFDHFVGYREETYSFDLAGLRERPLIWLMCARSQGAFSTGAVCASFDWGYHQLFDPPLVAWRDDGDGSKITEYGKRFLRLHKDERFFLWLHYMEPHTKYQPSLPFRPLPSEITPERERFLRHIEFWGYRGEDVLRPVDLEGLISLYDGEIADSDALVGEILSELERQGLVNRTVIILNSDHGEEFYDHGGYAHGHSFYDELIRVPLIISGPAVETPGRMVETQVRLLDLLPTVCGIAGVPTPKEARGHSLVPFLRGEETEQLPAFSEVLNSSIFRKNALRQDSYKLIYDVDGGATELYNWRTDPHEQVNLADQHPEMVEEMLAELKAWMAQNAITASELPRQRPLVQALNDETSQRLRDVGY